MKRHRIKHIKIVFAVILFLFFACSKDENDSPLVGKWNAVSFMASEAVDENGDGETNIDLSEEIDCVAMEASFTAAGRFSIISSDATYDVQIVDGKVVLVPTGCSSTTETGHWTTNESSTILYLEFDIAGKEDPYLMEIQIEVSNDWLVLKDLSYSDDGSITYTVEFEKK